MRISTGQTFFDAIRDRTARIMGVNSERQTVLCEIDGPDFEKDAANRASLGQYPRKHCFPISYLKTRYAPVQG